MRNYDEIAARVRQKAEERLAEIEHPKFRGIDLNSQFEVEPGLKEISKLSVFINNIRNYEQNK